MNDKTNFTGYSQTLGVSSGNTSATLTTNCNGTVTTYADGNWATPLNGGSRTITYPNNLGLSTLITNQNNMVKQVKVAVFTVERNDKNIITSAKFVKELWVEVKLGATLELTVAKQLDKDYDPSTTIVREIYSVTF